MALLQPSPNLTTTPPPAGRPPGRWRRRLALLRLRLRAWRVSRRDPEAHLVATLIARGQWAALDRLLDDLDRHPPAPPAA
jgi:hypothetical protein